MFAMETRDWPVLAELRDCADIDCSTLRLLLKPSNVFSAVTVNAGSGLSRKRLGRFIFLQKAQREDEYCSHMCP